MINVDNGVSLPYFVLEGLDGVGKSALIPLIADALRDAGYQVNTIVEPSDYFSDTGVVGWLDKSSNKTPLAVAMVQFALRIEQIKRIKKTNFLKDTIILADRSYLSSFVYQGEAISQNLMNMADLPIIDHSFHIHIPYEEAIRRIDSRNFKDANDITDEKKYNKMASDYKELCDTSILNNIRVVAANEILRVTLEVIDAKENEKQP